MSTEYLLAVVADRVAKRQDVADMYGIALLGNMESIAWPRVNAAIVRRWSRSGLQWIKRAAWRERDKLARVRVGRSAPPNPETHT